MDIWNQTRNILKQLQSKATSQVASFNNNVSRPLQDNVTRPIQNNVNTFVNQPRPQQVLQTRLPQARPQFQQFTNVIQRQPIVATGPTLGQVGGFVRDVGQGIFRNVASADKTFNPYSFQNTPQYKAGIKTPIGSNLSSMIFGNEQPTTFQERAKAGIGIPLTDKKIQGNLAYPLIAGSVLLDLMPMSSGGKKLAQVVAKSKTLEEFIKVVGKNKNLAQEVQKIISDTKNPLNSIEDIFNKAKGVEGGMTDTKIIAKVDEFQIGGRGEKISYTEQPQGEKSVKYFEDKIKAGERPPVTVGRASSGNRVVVDGNHTLNAYKNLGITDIPIKEQSVGSYAPTTPPQSGVGEITKQYKTADEYVKAQELAYHGSPVPLKRFHNKSGVYFTNSMEDASGFAGTPDNVYEGYLNFKKPLVIDAKGAKWDELNTKYGKSTQEIVGNAQKEGFDGVVFKNLVDNQMDTAGVGGESTISYAFKPKDAFKNEDELREIYNKSRLSQQSGGASKGTSLVQQSDQIPKVKIESPVQTTKESSRLVDNSSPEIIAQPGKLNVKNLNLSDEGKNIVRSADTAPKTVIGNKEVIKAAKLTEGSKTPMTDAQQQRLLASRLNSREKVVTLAKQLETLRKSNAGEAALVQKMREIQEQALIAKQEGAFAGRQLQAQQILADELATPMQKVLAMLDNAGIPAEKYLKDAAKVDWNNSKQVVAFYRKYVKGSFGEYLTEFRYTNMLSSPLTHIVNTASNIVQSAVIAPIEKTISGGLDLVKSALTGSERQYYVSDGIKYTVGYWKNLPEAISKFKKTITGAEVNIKPDMERIPVSTGGAWSIYTLPLKTLEASDQFFMSLVKGGEKASLQGRKLSAAEITVRAENSAKYRLFRQKFDPTGELGNGYLLRTWDKYNAVVQQLRRVPGGNWVVPFLQTPTNLLKQGVEYSPLGLLTVPGSKRPIEQLSKTIIGTTVFTGVYSLLQSTPFTWSVPTGKKERELFYAANMQPYSIKIGNKWVSYSKLGPLSYPIAMAAALRYAEKYDLPTDRKSVISTAVGGSLQFFADQSYVKNLGDVIDAVSTGQGLMGGAEKQISNMTTQLVPYKSFLGWMARMIDPVNRKSDGFVDGITSQLPFLSKNSGSYFNPVTKAPSQRSNPILNSFSPYKITTGDQSIENRFNFTGSAKRAYTNIMALPQEERSAMYQKIKADSPAIARGIVDIKNEIDLGITGEDKAIKNLNVDERAYALADKFNSLETKEEKSALWKKYVKAKIITKEVSKQLKILLQK